MMKKKVKYAFDEKDYLVEIDEYDKEKKWLTEKEEEKLIKIFEKKGGTKMIRELQEILSKKGFYKRFFK